MWLTTDNISYAVLIAVNEMLEDAKCYGDKFPRGPVVKNLPANAGDMGSIPGPGILRMPRGRKAQVLQLLKPVHLEPVFHNKRGHPNAMKSSPHYAVTRESHGQQ